jgi:hypothetical protein
MMSLQTRDDDGTASSSRSPSRALRVASVGEMVAGGGMPRKQPPRLFSDGATEGRPPDLPAPPPR